MNATEAEAFKQFKALCEIRGGGGYDSPGATKVKNVEVRLKNRKVKLSDEVEKTQSASFF